MPITYTIDVEDGLVLSVGEGVVTAQDLFRYLQAQLRDPAVPQPLRDLHDLSGVERFEVPANAMRRAVAGALGTPNHIRDARLAVIAPRDEVFGMYRMFQLLSEHAPETEALRERNLAPNVAVFRDREEARQWLLATLPTSPTSGSPILD